MGRRSKTSIFADFSGGLNTDASPTSLELKEAVDLDNIVLLPKGGFRKRYGNSAFNGTAMASGAAVHGLGYYRQLDGDEWLMTICGTKIFKSEFDGTMDDITDTLTITTGQDNQWTYSQMNDLAIFIGGARASDVPIKWAGSSNAAVLGGTPPVGKFGITGNNRLFIGNTVANPSRINWCILGNPEDWSGAGSGSQDVSTNDGDTLVGAALIGVDHLLLFKQNSIHELVIRTSPFPLFPLFSKVGAISQAGIVNVDGVIYFITPEPRMRATDGTRIIDFPDTIDSVWDSLVKARLPYLQGFYDKSRGLVLWFCTNGVGTGNNFCIGWDLMRKAWIKFTTGHSMNTVALVRDRSLYGGAYNGKIYLLDDNSTYDDASESSTAVNAYWRSGWLDMGDMILAKHIPYMDINFKTSSVSMSQFDVTYGYDFNTDQKAFSVAMDQGSSLYDVALYDVDVYGGLSDKTKLNFLKGNGKFFQYMLKNANTTESFQINRLALPVNADEPMALR